MTRNEFSAIEPKRRDDNGKLIPFEYANFCSIQVDTTAKHIFWHDTKHGTHTHSHHTTR